MDTLFIHLFAVPGSARCLGGVGCKTRLDRLFFAASDGSGTRGVELWSSDGTREGTGIVRDIRLGLYASSPFELTAVGNWLYFMIEGETHYELWKSDGSEAGTVQVAVTPMPVGSYVPSDLTTVGNQFYFEARDSEFNSELWKSDGTAAGTVMLNEVNPGPASGAFSYLTVVNNALFFRGDDGVHGMELWRFPGLANDPPIFVLNHPDGAPGSNFLINAAGFPAGVRVQLSVNGTTVGTPLTVGSDGGVRALLQTAAGAAPVRCGAVGRRWAKRAAPGEQHQRSHGKLSPCRRCADARAANRGDGTCGCGSGQHRGWLGRGLSASGQALTTLVDGDRPVTQPSWGRSIPVTNDPLGGDRPVTRSRGRSSNRANL